MIRPLMKFLKNFYSLIWERERERERERGNRERERGGRQVKGERERERERERHTHTHTHLLFTQLCSHWLIPAHAPTGIELAALEYAEDAPTNWATWPGSIIPLIKQRERKGWEQIPVGLSLWRGSCLMDSILSVKYEVALRWSMSKKKRVWWVCREKSWSSWLGTVSLPEK